MLLRQAGPDRVHVHAAQAGQGRVVELMLHAGQLASLPLHREQDGWGRVHVGGAVLPGHQVDDAGHGWGAESAEGFAQGSGQPDTLPRGDTALARADLSTAPHLRSTHWMPDPVFSGAPMRWQGHSDNVTRAHTQRMC